MWRDILNPGSWDAALLAAGSTLSAMKHIIDGHGKIVYALVRPPGHHAQPTQADGYCFLNNAGLAVQLALDGGCRKVVVLDIDVHYGNGTAEGFYHSDKVLTISLHMNHGLWGPSHPQGGTVDELGEGEGEGFGYNLNIPLPNGTGNKGYGYAMQHLVVPAIEKFDPDMMVLVVGQDSSSVHLRQSYTSSVLSCLISYPLLGGAHRHSLLAELSFLILALVYWTIKQQLDLLSPEYKLSA